MTCGDAVKPRMSKRWPKISYSSALFGCRFERASDGSRFAVNDRQQNPRRAMRLPAPLLPLAHSGGGKPEASGKFRLGQMQLFPNGSHINLSRRNEGDLPTARHFLPSAVRWRSCPIFPCVTSYFGLRRGIHLGPVNPCRAGFVRGDAHDSAVLLGRWLFGTR